MPMRPVPRLSITCVRPADAHDPITPDAPGERVLVVGQPPVAHARLHPDGDGSWSLTGLEVPESDPHKLVRMLLHGAFGMVLDAGDSQLRADVDHPDLGEYGFVTTDSGDLVRDLADEPDPVPAVSVIPLRDGPAGLEVFVQHRVPTMDFVPGAVVFPGGRVDPPDTELGARLELPDGFVDRHLERWASTGYVPSSPDPDAAARTLLATGVREMEEETGARVEASRLVPWDNWVTPIGWPRRFDVSFFVLAVEGDRLVNTTTEAHTSEWIPLDDLVSQVEAGNIAMVPPTRAAVDELQVLGSMSAVMGLEPRITAVRHDVGSRRPRSSV